MSTKVKDEWGTSTVRGVGGTDDIIVHATAVVS